MKFTLIFTLVCIINTSLAFPRQDDSPSISNTNTDNKNVFVFAEDTQETPHDNPDVHENAKKFVAIPISNLNSDTKILKNQLGEAVVAKAPENINDADDEDLVTADALVFRPLFAYRRKQAQRQRVYQVPSNVRRVYYVPRDYEHHYHRQNYWPDYYKKAEFPTLAPHYQQKWDWVPSQVRRQYTVKPKRGRYPSYYENAEFPTLA